MDNITFNIWEEKDKLGIAEKVSGLAQIIMQTDESMVCSLNAPFGIGKSFFCSGLQAYLQERGICCIYYNVWEVDFYQNPLTPLLCEITEKIEKQYNTDNTKKEIFKNLKFFGKAIVSSIKIEIGLPDIGKVSIDGEKGLKRIEKAQKAEQQQDICNQYRQYRQNVKEFKECLSKIATYNHPLVIIVDELDRCRPDYAIEVLETIKHLFDIPGIVFVLSIDDAQLQNSVKQLYGPLNYNEYMRKFVNYSFALPQPDNEKYAAYLCEKYNLTEVLSRFSQIKLCSLKGSQNISKFIQISFAAYSLLFNFSLRAQNQVMQRLILFLKSLEPKQNVYPELAVFLACVREYSKDLYKELKNNQWKGDTLHYIRSFIGTDKLFNTDKFDKLIKQISTTYYYDYGKYREYNSCDVFMQALSPCNYNAPNELQSIAQEMELYNMENHPQHYFNKMDFIDSFFASESDSTVAAE